MWIQCCPNSLFHRNHYSMVSQLTELFKHNIFILTWPFDPTLWRLTCLEYVEADAASPQLRIKCSALPSCCCVINFCPHQNCLRPETPQVVWNNQCLHFPFPPSREFHTEKAFEYFLLYSPPQRQKEINNILNDVFKNLIHRLMKNRWTKKNEYVTFINTECVISAEYILPS